MKPNHKAGLELLPEESLQALITLHTAMVDMGVPTEQQDIDESSQHIRDLVGLVQESVESGDKHLQLDASQKNTLLTALEKARQNINISRGVVGLFCVEHDLSDGQAVEEMSKSKEELLKKAALVYRAGGMVLTFGGLLTLSYG